MVIIVKRAAAERQNGKMHQRPAPHHLPGIVFQQVEKILLGRGFFRRRRFDAFLRGGERDEEQHEAQHRPNDHRHLPAVLLVRNSNQRMAVRTAGSVARGEFRHQRQREAADDELRRVHRHETIRVQAGAFIDVAGHHAAERGVGHVVHRVDGHQHHVGDAGVGNHRGGAPPEVRRGVGQDHHDEPRHGGEQDPRAEFAPTRVRAVGEDANDGIGHGVPQTRPQQNHRRRAGRQAENVRVKIQLEQHHRHEDEVRGGVGATVTGLFEDREFLLVMLFGHNVFWGLNLFRHRQHRLLQFIVG